MTRILPKSRGVRLCLLLVLALSSLALSLTPDVKVVGDVEVVGFAEIRKLKIFNVFSGLRVTIECKAADSKDHFVTKGSGEIDELGKFHLSVPHDDIVGDDGSLKEACYAHLQTPSGNLCPALDGLEASKIVFLSKSEDKHVLGLKGKLKFSPEVCISKFFWPKIKTPCPPIYKPPVVIPKKPTPPKTAHQPIQKPIHKSPVVIPKKPSPPKISHKPIYKSPDPPIHKTPVVIPKKPSPPLHKPTYKPPAPIYKSPVPIYKPPVVVIPKKPCPPFPKFPFFPPKDITHPKFGKWPPFPSHP